MGNRVDWAGEMDEEDASRGGSGTGERRIDETGNVEQTRSGTGERGTDVNACSIISSTEGKGAMEEDGDGRKSGVVILFPVTMSERRSDSVRGRSVEVGKTHSGPDTLFTVEKGGIAAIG
jgi:hypothetical protein